jgi:hypothetical protein
VHHADCAALNGRCLQDFQLDLLRRVRVASTVEHEYLRPFSEYILELSLLKYEMLRFSARMLAASSVLLARVGIAHIRMPATETTPRIYRHSCRSAVVWTQELEDGVKLDAPDLEDCTHELLLLLWHARKAARRHAAGAARDIHPACWGDFEQFLLDSDFAEDSDGCLDRDSKAGPPEWEHDAFVCVFRRYCCSEHHFVPAQPLIARVPPEAFVSRQAFDFATEAFGPLPVGAQVPDVPWYR